MPVSWCLHVLTDSYLSKVYVYIYIAIIFLEALKAETQFITPCDFPTTNICKLLHLAKFVSWWAQTGYPLMDPVALLRVPKTLTKTARKLHHTHLEYLHACTQKPTTIMKLGIFQKDIEVMLFHICSKDYNLPNLFQTERVVAIAKKDHWVIRSPVKSYWSHWNPKALTQIQLEIQYSCKLEEKQLVVKTIATKPRLRISGMGKHANFMLET